MWAVREAHGSFYLKLCHLGAPGASRDVAEDAQEAGAANGYTTGHSVKVRKKFKSKITEEGLPWWHSD